MKKLFHSMTIGLISLGAMAPGLQSAGAAPEAEPLRIVTTTAMIADVVRAVAQDRAEVKHLMGEGSDPHLYAPTRGDVVALQQADLIFYNGLLLEGRMGDVLARVGRRGKPVVAVAEVVRDREDFVLLHDEEGPDPHLWMDPRIWVMVTAEVARVLSEIEPDHAEFFAAGAQAYSRRLLELDAYARTVIGSIPPARRHLVTAHDAFGYLGRAYGLEVHGIQGLSTETEAGVRDIENLIKFIVGQEIPAIFIETSISDRNVRAVVEGADARGHRLIIGGELFSDAMGPADSYEGTYIGMIDHNVSTIAAALGGEVPERGMQGKLSKPLGLK